MLQVIEKYKQVLLEQNGPRLVEQPQMKSLGASNIIPRFNPFAEVITAKTPEQLLAVIQQYRANDPLTNTKFGAKPLEDLINHTLNLPDSFSHDTKIAEVKKILKRDAYFLDKEKAWLSLERDRIQNMAQNAQMGHSPSFEVERQQQVLKS